MLEAAVDDKGASLIPDESALHDSTKFTEYSNAFFRKSNFGFDNDNHPAAPEVELDLAVPSRAATKIARLRGSLELADAGTLRTIEVTTLNSAGKKAVPMPPGASVGITVNVAAGDNVRSISLEMTGDQSALESAEVVDATGRKISNGMSSWSFNGGPIHKSIGLNQSLDDSMKLVVKVSLDRKIIKVPFDLKDITLP